LIYSAIDGEVETIFGDSVAAIDERATSVHVGFEGGPSRSFDLVIGPGGLHSPVRRLVFGPEASFERDLGYRVAAFGAQGYRPRDELVYVTYGIPGRMVGRIAMRGDRTMFLFVFADEHMAGPNPRDLGEIKSMLRMVFGDAGWECREILDVLEQAQPSGQPCGS
jgi:2-polyprenyl-6-methoxyphenol hydroxylase-like FAD-dependent oxidoreductase